jgi:HSP20 family protein
MALKFKEQRGKTIMKLIPVLRKSEPVGLWSERPIFPTLFDEFFGEWPFRSATAETSPGWIPAVDILEKDGNLILRAELPGMNEKDIDLKLDGKVLTLKGERKQEEEQESHNYHRTERFHGTFSRSFTLPDSADRDQIKADYKSGVLTVTIPQKPEVKPREIPVTVN